MPIRIQPNRPYYPRYYLPRRVPVGGGVAAGRGGRAAPGGGLDTSPTGNVGADIVKAINATMQQNRQNVAANQLLNTQTPPRAAWVGGTQPGANVPLTGTAPQTGGVGELQMRQQQSQQDLADQLQRAKIAAQLALVQQRTGRGGGAGGGGAGGNAAAWKAYLSGGATPGGRAGGKAGKPVPYEPGSIDPMSDPNADKFPVVQADFDGQYGQKGLYGKVASHLGNLDEQVDADGKKTGNYVVNDAKGQPIITLSPQDANYWLARVNAARVRAGQQPIGADKFPTANPNSGQAAGTAANPYAPKTPLEIRSLPNGSSFVYPDLGKDYPYPQGAAPGAVGVKGPEAASQNQPAQQAQPPTRPTAAIDQTGGNQVVQAIPPPAMLQDQATALAANVPPDQGDQAGTAIPPPQATAGPQVATTATSPVVMPVPIPPPNMRTGIGTDVSAGAMPDIGTGNLADAIRRAQVGNQLQGLA